MNSRWTAGTMLSGLDFGVVVFITSGIHCLLEKPPASPEDSSGSTVPGMVRRPSGSFAPFPLTLTLSLREREQRARRSGKPRCLDCAPRREGFTLSPRRGEGWGEGCVCIRPPGCPDIITRRLSSELRTFFQDLAPPVSQHPSLASVFFGI